MASYAVFRMEGRNRALFSGKLGKHNRREAVPEYAVERPDRPRVVPLHDERERAKEVLKQSAKLPKRRGRKPDPGIEVVVLGPPPYDPVGQVGESAEWTDEQVHAYGRDARDWILDRLGRDPETAVGVLVEAHIHQDERTPHYHFGILAAAENCPRFSRRRVELALAGIEPEDGDVRGPNNRAVVRTILDRFHDEVGRKYGLERGEVGSARRYFQQDHLKGVSDRLAEQQAATVVASGRCADYEADLVVAKDAAEKAAEAEEKARAERDDAARSRDAADVRARVAVDNAARAGLDAAEAKAAKFRAEKRRDAAEKTAVAAAQAAADQEQAAKRAGPARRRAAPGLEARRVAERRAAEKRPAAVGRRKSASAAERAARDAVVQKRQEQRERKAVRRAAAPPRPAGFVPQGGVRSQQAFPPAPGPGPARGRGR